MIKQKHINLFDVTLYLAFTVIMFVMLFPFWKVVVTSIASYRESVTRSFTLFPRELDFGAYRMIFTTNEFMNSMWVTFRIAIFGVLYNLLLTLTLAYGLSIKEVPGRGLLISFVLIPFFFSGGLIPLYLQVKNLGLLDSLLSVVLPLGINGWYLIIAKNYFCGISPSLREAARVDGANDLQIFLRIILPISKVMISVFLLFYAVERWNEWYYAMLFINDSRKIPLLKLLRDITFNNFETGSMAVAYRQLSGSPVDSESVKCASTVVAMVPILMVYPFLQRHFTSGVMVGAVKE